MPDDLFGDSTEQGEWPLRLMRITFLVRIIHMAGGVSTSLEEYVLLLA
jgi:hypothetical protein